MKNEHLIVIATVEKNHVFLRDCLNSFRGYDKYPIMVVVTGAGRTGVTTVKRLIDECGQPVLAIESLTEDSSEFGGVFAAWRCSEADEIFLMHDTCEVLDPDLFELVFKDFNGSSVPMQRAYSEIWVSCLGKYRRSILDKLDLRSFLPLNRVEAMETEILFTQAYSRSETKLIDFPEPMVESDDVILRHGQHRRCVSNRYLRKWKANWSIDKLFENVCDGQVESDRISSQQRMAAAVLSGYFEKPKG